MRHSGKNEKKYCVRKYFISKHPGTGRVEITVISEDITFPLQCCTCPSPLDGAGPGLLLWADRRHWSQEVTSTIVLQYNSTHKVCTTHNMNWENLKLRSKKNCPFYHLIRVHLATFNLDPMKVVEIQYYRREFVCLLSRTMQHFSKCCGG